MSKHRPAHWAALPAAPIPGLANFHVVSPVLYRGAQPTAEGMRALEGMGVKTVVSLRQHHNDAGVLPNTKMTLHNFGFDTWHPDYEDVVRFLRTVTNPAAVPVYVHCQFGSDRTGTVCAIYRVIVQGWDKEEAIREMKDGGFGYHAMWINLPHYLRELDVAALKQRAGITST